VARAIREALPASELVEAAGWSFSDEQLLLVIRVRQAGRDDASGLVRVIERDPAASSPGACASDFRERTDRGRYCGARELRPWRHPDREQREAVRPRRVLEGSRRRHPLFGSIRARRRGWCGVTSTAAVSSCVSTGAATSSTGTGADRKLLRRLGHLWLPRPLGKIDHRDPELTRELVTNAAHINGVAPCPGGILVSLGRIRPPKTFAKRRVRGLRNRLASRVGASPKEPEPAHKKSKVVGAPIEGCRSAIVRIAHGGDAELVFERNPTTVPNHNIIQLDDWLVFNDTNNATTSAASLTTKQVIRSVAIPGAPAFARGLAHLGGTRFLVGSQEPAAVYEIDLESETIVRTLDVDGMKNECIYGIVVLPPAFGIPTTFQL
jgi:hypothetical protein